MRAQARLVLSQLRFLPTQLDQLLPRQRQIRRTLATDAVKAAWAAGDRNIEGVRVLGTDGAADTK